MHLITYASPVTKSMLHFSRLGYYALPQLPPSYVVPFWLSTEVALFAGRLYLDFVEYQAVERFLHLAGSNPGAPNAATELSVEDPINFTREWLTLRRKGQDITHTPMGYVCSGRRLHRAHPFFIAPGCKARQNGGIQAGNQSGGECSEVDGDENDDEGFA